MARNSLMQRLIAALALTGGAAGYAAAQAKPQQELPAVVVFGNVEDANNPLVLTKANGLLRDLYDAKDLSQSGRELTGAMLAALTGEKAIVKRDMADLMPEAFAQMPVQSWNENSGVTPDIYVLPNLGDVHKDKPQVQLWTTIENKQILFINEPANRWDPAYVKEYIQFNGDQIEDAVRREHLLTPETYLWRKRAEMGGDTKEYKRFAAFFDGLVTDAANNADGLGVRQNEALIDIMPQYDKSGMPRTDTYAQTVAASLTSRQGDNYVFISSEFIEKAYAEAIRGEKDKDPAIRKAARMIDDVAELRSQIGGITAHEGAHNEYGDSAVQGYIAARDPVTEHAMEMRGDLRGAIRTGDPDALIARYTIFLMGDADAYRSAHPDEQSPPVHDEAYLKKVSQWWQGKGDPGHPLETDRIAALHMLKAEMEKSPGKSYSEEEAEKLVRGILEKIYPGNALSTQGTTWAQRTADTAAAQKNLGSR